MSIYELSQLVTPPATPSGQRANAWEDTENRLGVALPTDYKSLVETYGAGRFADFLTIYTPFSRGQRNLMAQRELALDAYRTVRATRPQAAPYPAYPEPGGLLPWAGTDNGDVLYWLTEGPSDTWPTIVMEARHALSERYDLAPSELLAQFLRGQLASRVLPNDVGEDERTFSAAGPA